MFLKSLNCSLPSILIFLEEKVAEACYDTSNCRRYYQSLPTKVEFSFWFHLGSLCFVLSHNIELPGCHVTFPDGVWGKTRLPTQDLCPLPTIKRTSYLDNATLILLKKLVMFQLFYKSLLLSLIHWLDRQLGRLEN